MGHMKACSYSVPRSLGLSQLGRKQRTCKKLTLYISSYLGQLNQGVWSFQQNIKDEETKILFNTLHL